MSKLNNLAGKRLKEQQLVIFTDLKLWVAVARHNFKWVENYCIDC